MAESHCYSQLILKECDTAVQLDSWTVGESMQWSMYPDSFSLQCLTGCALYLENVSEHFNVVTSVLSKNILNFENINPFFSNWVGDDAHSFI